MSDPPQPFGPFGGFDLNQMLRFLQAEGPVHWQVGAQVARWVAEGGAGLAGLLPGMEGPATGAPKPAVGPA
ncbi:MAG TPA: hypothetical protein VGL92_10225, partial [Acidimicrobiia bacterium]